MNGKNTSITNVSEKLSGLKYYSFSRLLKHYNQSFEQKFQNHNAI